MKSRDLAILIGGIVGAIVFLSMWLAWRHRPDDPGPLDPQSPQAIYRRMVESSHKPVLIGIPLVFALFAGLVGQAGWRTVQLFLNGESFGQTDPQFQKDLGFYAFDLPFWRFLVDTAVLAIIVAFLLSLVTHYMLGGIRAGNPKAQRYRLTESEILAAGHHGYELGFRTVVLQGGEEVHGLQHRRIRRRYLSSQRAGC